MHSLDRYILRTTLTSFALVLVTLTGLIWITQALRELDLMTSQGQTILTFLALTGLLIPILILIIAPIAIMIAIAHTLTKLATDSEVIVMNAAGLSPLQLLRPFLYSTLVVAALIMALAAYVAPACARIAGGWDADITADVMANILQPGRFSQISQNLTIRIRERQPGGLLVGIFVDDRRDPKERDSIIADHGTVLKNERGSFLVLQDGHLERFEAGQREPAMIAFAQYAFDLSQFADRGRSAAYGVRERYLWELTPPANDPSPGEYRQEFHDRLMSPLFAFAFVIVTFGYLGSPRTTRQSRSFSMTCAILSVLGLRIAGFALSVLSQKYAWAAGLQYLILSVSVAIALWMIMTSRVVEAPTLLVKTLDLSNRLLSRLTRRPATT